MSDVSYLVAELAAKKDRIRALEAQVRMAAKAVVALEAERDAARELLSRIADDERPGWYAQIRAFLSQPPGGREPPIPQRERVEEDAEDEAAAANPPGSHEREFKEARDVIARRIYRRSAETQERGT